MGLVVRQRLQLRLSRLVCARAGAPAARLTTTTTIQEFPSDEGPGLSVFYKDPTSGEIFHTYSTYARGLDPLVGTYTLLDLVPKGRDEDHLAFSMQWVRHHDRYQTNLFLDETLPYWPPNAAPEASTYPSGNAELHT